MKLNYSALIIDDNVVAQKQCMKALIKLGFSVAIASDIQKGQQMLSKEHFNVVFATLCAKNGGAVKIARWLKTRKPLVKIFILTGWRGEMERNILAGEGISGVIHKPLLFNEIKDSVIEHLG